MKKLLSILFILMTTLSLSACTIEIIKDADQTEDTDTDKDESVDTDKDESVDTDKDENVDADVSMTLADAITLLNSEEGNCEFILEYTFEDEEGNVLLLMELTTKIDGNIMYMNMYMKFVMSDEETGDILTDEEGNPLYLEAEEESYQLENEDGTIDSYSKNEEGDWVVTTSSEGTVSSAFDFEESFFEEIDGVYVIKSEYEADYGYVEIDLNGETGLEVYTVQFLLLDDFSISGDFSTKMYNFGKVELTLPTIS